jgi:hypothetical protein
MVAPAYNPGCAGRINKRIMIQAGLGKNMRPCPKITNAKKDWGHGSRGRTPA